MTSEVRLCQQCSSPISAMRRGNFCSKSCGAKHYNLVKQGGQELNVTRKSCAAIRKGMVIFHRCILGGGEGLDPFFADRCRCSKKVSFEKAASLVGRGEAIDFVTRKPYFEDRDIIQIGILKQTPRAATIEKSHMERATETHTTKRGTESQNVEALRAAVKEDRMLRDMEERVRMVVYQVIGVKALKIKQIPAEEYDQMQNSDPWRGRAIFASSSDERTFSKDAPPDYATFTRWDAEVEDEDVEPETELKAEEVEV
jgi:hypothetical protein